MVAGYTNAMTTWYEEHPTPQGDTAPAREGTLPIAVV
jgi:hypothetical protein